MSGVYSTRFIAGPIAAGSSESYTVPAGKVAIVKDISAASEATTSGLWVVVYAPNNDNPFALGYQNPSQPNAAFHWEGRAVVAAGETIVVVGIVLLGITVSGYLLDA